MSASTAEVAGDGVETIRQLFLVRCVLPGDFDPERILGGFVEEAAPGGGLAGENDRDHARLRHDHVQPIGAGGERFAPHPNVVGAAEQGVFVGPGAPGRLGGGPETQVVQPYGTSLPQTSR
jgi:hypothetical protein